MYFTFTSSYDDHAASTDTMINFEAETLNTIYIRFAEFLRNSGFDYVRYAGDGRFDNERWRDYHKKYLDNIKLEDIIKNEVNPTKTPFMSGI